MSRRGRARVQDDAPVNDTARVTCWGIVRQRGGYRMVEVRLPESLVEKYSTEGGAAAQPDLIEVTLHRVETAMRREVM